MVKGREVTEIMDLDDCSEVLREVESLVLEVRAEVSNPSNRFGKQTTVRLRRKLREVRSRCKEVMDFLGHVKKLIEDGLLEGENDG